MLHHVGQDLAPFTLFLPTLPRLERLEIQLAYPEEQSSTDMRLPSEVVPPSLRHLTLHCGSSSRFDQGVLTGEAAGRIETLFLHESIPRSWGVWPNVRDLGVCLEMGAPTTPASGVTDWLPALNRVCVRLEYDHWIAVVRVQSGVDREPCSANLDS